MYNKAIIEFSLRMIYLTIIHGSWGEYANLGPRRLRENYARLIKRAGVQAPSAYIEQVLYLTSFGVEAGP